jgi:hypothetical protein
MKKLLFCVLPILLAAVSVKATVLFSDSLNYPNGLIETDGLWYCYSPATPAQDAFVTNDLLILNSTHSDAVAVNFTNTTGSTLLYASFTINVSALPTTAGGYFCVFRDATNNSVSKIFIDASQTVVPNTYRIGIANFATSSTASGETNFPMDLATGVTYQVVFAYDPNTSDPLPNATLWINPSTADLGTIFGAGANYVFPTDTSTNTVLQNINITSIGFSQYANQGVAAIGNVQVGTTPDDISLTPPALPVFSTQPQSTSLYSGNNIKLFSLASGIDVAYQWLSNNVPLVDDGVNIIGSQNNVISLNSLQGSGNFSVVASDSAGSVTSAVAVVSVITTPTLPFFTIQPQGVTNSLFSPITLSALANGTGPITYEWYFEAPASSTFTDLGVSGTNYTFSGGYANSGSYYVKATGPAGSTPSAIVQVLVIPPPLISIHDLKLNITNVNSSVTINGGQIFNVEGVVTSFGDVLSTGTSEFYIQDGTGACLVYRGGFTASNTPPVGTLVQVISPAQSYYGEIEMDPTSGAATNAVLLLSYNNPLPAPVPLNIGQMATNDPAVLGSYGWLYQNALTTLTNVYLYSSATGAAVSGNFPTNSSKTLYAFQSPYSAGQPYIPIYVYTYTNALNKSNTNYFGKPIPSFCYQINGINGVYSALVNGERFYPTRYADFVTTPPAPFSSTLALTNGTPTLSWPTVTGSTYSIYSATNLLGPWTQIFGLGYYPSIGSYTDTNASPAKFYRVSTP